MEQWKATSFGNYEVSTNGLVRNITTKHVLKQSNEGFYFFVTLTSGITRKKCRVHRLVAEAFIDNPEGLPVVNHKDKNPANNHVSNLEWATYQYNAEHSIGRPIELTSFSGEKYLFPSITKAALFLTCKPASIQYYADNSIAAPGGFIVHYVEGGN